MNIDETGQVDNNFTLLKLTKTVLSVKAMIKYLVILIFIPFSVSQMKFLAVMDFDHTIVDKNSMSVFDSILSESELPQMTQDMFLETMSYIPHMNTFYKRLYDLKVSKEIMEECIYNLSAIEGMDTLLTMLHQHGSDIIIISNSNSYFVNNWLAYKSLSHTVLRVFTNPARFNQEGMINILAYQNQTKCRLSPSNLCKRSVMVKFIRQQKFYGISYNHVIYVGDGKNDYCAVIALHESDYVFPRLGYLLSNYINNAPPQKIKATVFPWVSGKDIIQVVETLIKIRDLY